MLDDVVPTFLYVLRVSVCPCLKCWTLLQAGHPYTKHVTTAVRQNRIMYVLDSVVLCVLSMYGGRSFRLDAAT